MSENNNNAAEATDTQLRNVPSDISEYRKFVESGGNEHNEKILGREAAVAAAKAAGIVPESAPGNETEEKKHLNKFQRAKARLNREIGARDAEIADLRKRLEAHESAAKPNGKPPNGAPAVPSREEGRAKAAAAPAQPVATKQDAPRPKEEDYKTYSEFVEALTDWKTAKAISERESRRAEEGARAANDAKAKEVLDAHNARVDEAKQRYADWDTAFKGLDDNSFSDPMVVYIFESERGPDVTYYLATHRDELERIRGLSPVKQAAALGRIEDRLEAEGEKDEGEGDDAKDAKDAKPAKVAKSDAEDDDEEEAKPQSKPKSGASKAPPPHKPLGGKGGADDAMPDPANFKAYEAWSKRQAAKGVKR